ncbi:hypothetical protein G7Z17_g6515 [Cylindrodendrum hubeiense]|uniref:Uncharacterized protein n=1 Tax=Cylindrodendrum hubeiense TaxID=595255 RepID=A0A9P5LG88_9HYPO|nr:hypothetical protein G7Z17_g6515 [Cylindrodendrum hubeiense]
MQLPTLPTAILIIAQLSAGVQANYAPGKATQINFYKDNICTNYAGEMAFWQRDDPTHTPWTGYRRRFDGFKEGDCHDFRQPKGTKSLNTVNCWNMVGDNWRPWCDCYVWDDWGCKGNTMNTVNTCAPGRSQAGYQWKSAKCWLLTDPK